MSDSALAGIVADLQGRVASLQNSMQGMLEEMLAIDPVAPLVDVEGAGGVTYFRRNATTGKYDPTAAFLNPRPYDLYYFDSKTLPTSFRIRGSKTNENTAISLPIGLTPTDLVSAPRWAQVAGVNVQVKQNASSGGGSANFDDTITVSAHDLIYLYMETTLATGATVTYLERYTQASGRHLYQDGGDDADGTKAYLYVPLWLINWSTDHISFILDLREEPRSDRAGN
jgi:hypothetical protein